MTTYHPLSIMVFYIVMGCLCICYMHPILLVACVLGGICNYFMTYGSRALLVFLKNCIGLWCLIVLMNMLVSHEGDTVLLYISNTVPITLESIIYGGCMGTMVIGSLLWFLSFSAVMTSDKWMYVFGDRLPIVGLLFSMVLRFIPLINSRYQEICQLHAMNQVSLTKWEQIKMRLHCFGIAVTWALEKGVITADSMEARGYGLGRRSHYSQFRFRVQDGVLIVAILFLVGFLVVGINCGVIWYQIYPVFTVGWNLETISLGIGVAMFGLYPVWNCLLDRKKWRKGYVHNT